MMIEPSPLFHPTLDRQAPPNADHGASAPAHAAGGPQRRPAPFPPRLEIAPLTIPRPSATAPGQRLPIC